MVRTRPDAPSSSRAGRALIVVGGLILLFVVWEFGLTSLPHERVQLNLLSVLRRELPTATLDAPAAPVADGGPMALLAIPRLGLEQVVVEGTTGDHVKSGPGHLRSSPLPGELGNSVIAARRTTYGGPFRELDRLSRGDRIRLTTGQGTFSYRVVEVRTVRAGRPDPVTRTDDSRVTLITSDPAFVASGRLAVIARLEGAPLAVARRPAVSTGAEDLGLAGNPAGLVAAAFAALLFALALGVTRSWGRRWPPPVRWMYAAPVLVAAGLLLFSSLDRALPGTL